MILLEENFKDILIENAKDAKKMYLKGIFMESEQKNRNGRIYKKNEIATAVQKVNESAKAGKHILGQLDHPQDLEVRLENVSHKILEMSMEGNNAIGKAEILDKTPKGQIAISLIESGIQLGVSSRGSGSVNEDTNIVEGFSFVTVDLVASPSAINAYPTSVMEAIEMYKRGYIVNDLAEAVLHDDAAQKYFQEEIIKFVKETFNK